MFDRKGNNYVGNINLQGYYPANRLYKANHDICREDFGVFEDTAYKLQEELFTKVNA